MGKTDQIGIGMIGAGGIAKSRHLPGLKKISGISLEAVANRSLASSQKAAETHGFNRYYDNWKQVVDDPQVDAVFICTPPYMHAEMTIYALSKKKHVFCQARMAMDFADALCMKEADEHSAQTTMLCPAPHYMQVEPVLLQMIKSGELGDIHHIALSHTSSNFLDPNQPLHWRQRADLQGINILEVGMMAEVLQKWFGHVDALHAIGKTVTDIRPADADGKTKVELPDAVSLSAQFDTGITLTGLFSSVVKGGGKPHMVIYGSKASVTCYAHEAEMVLHDGNAERTITISAEESGHWTVEKDFIDAVREGRKGSPSFADGVRYMAFTQAVWDSLASGGERMKLQR